ncbi:hypothetical protein ALC53_05183 [Atta colombica]|uniref:Uncharacterized protein n=1 Tax=Atta colombica TaxID=520822 RepID=A0A195BJ53_9HYME|nr:hypothetical protein ALC53_05183 [Atta colombica]
MNSRASRTNSFGSPLILSPLQCVRHSDYNIDWIYFASIQHARILHYKIFNFLNSQVLYNVLGIRMQKLQNYTRCRDFPSKFKFEK